MNLRAMEKVNKRKHYAIIIEPGQRFKLECFLNEEIEYITRVGNFSWDNMWKDAKTSHSLIMSNVPNYSLEHLRGHKAEVVCELERDKLCRSPGNISKIYLIKIRRKYAVINEEGLEL